MCVCRACVYVCVCVRERERERERARECVCVLVCKYLSVSVVYVCAACVFAYIGDVCTSTILEFSDRGRTFVSL